MTTWNKQDKSGSIEKRPNLTLDNLDSDVLLISGSDKLLLNANVEQQVTTVWTKQTKS